MALTKCKECKKEVSTAAETCPHCGVKYPGAAPVAATSEPGNIATGIGTLIVLGLICAGIYSCSSSSDKDKADDAAAKAAEVAKEVACKADLQCWGDKGIVAAGVYCKTPIEKLAKYSARWTDETFEMKFSRFHWLDKDKAILTFIGDKVQFQNGFGAYQSAIYECDFDQVTNRVLDVRAQPVPAAAAPLAPPSPTNKH